MAEGDKQPPVYLEPMCLHGIVRGEGPKDMPLAAIGGEVHTSPLRDVPGGWDPKALVQPLLAFARNSRRIDPRPTHAELVLLRLPAGEDKGNPDFDVIFEKLDDAKEAEIARWRYRAKDGKLLDWGGWNLVEHSDQLGQGQINNLSAKMGSLFYSVKEIVREPNDNRGRALFDDVVAVDDRDWQAIQRMAVDQ